MSTVVLEHDIAFVLCRGGAMRWSIRVCLLPDCRGWGGREVYGCWVFVRVWKIAFGNTVWGSFRWLFAVNFVWMWNLSIVFKWAAFLWQCTICMILLMGPNE